MTIVKVVPGCVWLVSDLSRAVGTLTWAEAKELHEQWSREGFHADLSSAVPADLSLDGIIDLEEAIRDGLERFGDLESALAWQLATTAATLGGDAIALADPAAAEDAIRGLASRLRAFLGDAHPSAASGHGELVPFLSLFRLQLLLEFGARRGQFRSGGDFLLRMPFLLLALFSYAEAGRRAAPGLPAKSLDFNTLAQLTERFAGRIEALARFGDRVEAGASPGAERERLALDDAHGRVLGEHMAERVKGLPIPARVALLDELAGALPGLPLGWR